MKTRIAVAIVVLLAGVGARAGFAGEAASSKKAAAGKKGTAGSAAKDKAGDEAPDESQDKAGGKDAAEKPRGRHEQATFGSGCFWCAEAAFERLKGVESVVSGYSGGKAKNPSYELVCTGLTGHAEVVQITYDPSVISYEELLDVFFKTHDPTQLNRQGPDVGTQYRSVIFYHDDEQKEQAEKFKEKLMKQGRKKRIATEISPLTEFYPAEEHHQNYYRTHPDAPYCQTEVRERVHKVNRAFKGKLKGKQEELAE